MGESQSMEWQLQDAKNRFSELVQRARREGPQVVTLRGERAAVVLSAEAYDALVGGGPTLVDHLLAEPTWPDDLVETVNTRAKKPSCEPIGSCLSSIPTWCRKPAAGPQRRSIGLEQSTQEISI